MTLSLVSISSSADHEASLAKIAFWSSLYVRDEPNMSFPFGILLEEHHVTVLEQLLNDPCVAACDVNEAVERILEVDELPVAVVEQLTNDPRVNRTAAFAIAAAYGCVAINELLLREGVNPAAYNNYAVRRAAKGGHIAIVERLISDPRVEPNAALLFAAKYGQMAIVELLLGCERVNPAAYNNYAIRMAASGGHVAVVERLLKDLRCDPTAAFCVAAGGGHVAVVDLLFEKGANPTGDNNYAIRMAASGGHIAVIERLLSDERVDPTVHDNDAIRTAATGGHILVVERLLKDPRVDLTARNRTIGVAALLGHSVVVELLLKDVRVDPSANNNFAIRTAASLGHVTVVEQLLKDARVDPACAIRDAAQNGHQKVTDLLRIAQQAKIAFQRRLTLYDGAATDQLTASFMADDREAVPSLVSVSVEAACSLVQKIYELVTPIVSINEAVPQPPPMTTRCFFTESERAADDILLLNADYADRRRVSVPCYRTLVPLVFALYTLTHIVELKNTHTALQGAAEAANTMRKLVFAALDTVDHSEYFLR
jgi:ankyrin repeat protein